MAREPTLTTKITLASPLAEDLVEIHPQSRRPIAERFHLEVDHQTKKSYSTAEVAVEAAKLLKRKYPLLQVVVYDSVELSRTVTVLEP